MTLDQGKDADFKETLGAAISAKETDKYFSLLNIKILAEKTEDSIPVKTWT
jgi:hypothetical protein